MSENFEQLYSTYSDMVYNLCLNYLQNEEDAQDMTQEVFVKLHHKLEKFEGKASLKTWIYRITINTCLDQIRKNKRKKRFGIHIFIGNNQEDYQPEEFKHPGIILEDKEALEGLFKNINRLPDKQKTALLLISTEGLKNNEIAEIMKLSDKAVESLLGRARKKLQEFIDETRDKN